MDPVALLVGFGLSWGKHEMVLLMGVGIELGGSELGHFSRISGFAQVAKQARCEGRSLQIGGELDQKDTVQKNIHRKVSNAAIPSIYRVYVYGTISGERKEARVEAGLVCVVWWYRLQKTIRHPVTADKNNVLRVRRDELCHTRNFSGGVDVVFGPA